MEALGGFFIFYVVMSENGFWPGRLFGIRAKWDSQAINDLEDSYGQEWVSFEKRELIFKKMQLLWLFSDLRGPQATGIHLSHGLFRRHYCYAMG